MFKNFYHAMYDAASDAAIIQASAQVASSALSYAASGDTNRRTLKYNREMYDKQRADAIADRDFANQYNSPQQVMERYKNAGLNPNLIYGNGTNAESAPVRSASPGNVSLNTPHVNLDAGSAIAAYNNTKMVQAQTDNMKKQGELLDLQKLFTAAQTGKVVQDTDTSKFSLGQQVRLADTNAQALQLTVDKMANDIDMSRQGNARAWEMQAEQILNMQKQRTKTDADMKQIDANIDNMKNDINLRRAMFEYQQSADAKAPFWYKAAKELLMKYFDSTTSDSILNDAKKMKQSTGAGGFLDGLLGPVRRMTN